jgi:signal peptidase I
LKSLKTDDALYTSRKGDLPLSGYALTELLRAVLNKGMPFRFSAKGFSMSPFIQNGDVITLLPLSGKSLRVGDVVAFIRPGTRYLVVHRVIRRKGNKLLIKGDNFPYADGFIPKSDILGYVSHVERNGKEISFGLGPERILIVLLTRWYSVRFLIFWIWRIICPVVRRDI